jgi:hypothetical protein
MEYGRTHIVGCWETLYDSLSGFVLTFSGDGDNFQAMMIKGTTRMERNMEIL